MNVIEVMELLIFLVSPVSPTHESVAKSFKNRAIFGRFRCNRFFCCKIPDYGTDCIALLKVSWVRQNVLPEVKKVLNCFPLD